jgi:hypothetical protein
MYIWDEIVDFWDFHRLQVILGLAGLIVALAGFAGYHHATCCKPAPPLQCILLDASRSAYGARTTYSDLSEEIVAEQSRLDGQVCVVDVAGAPASESDVQHLDVGAEHTDNSSTAAFERSRNQLKAKQVIDDLLENPPVKVGGSAFVEALALIGPKLHPGETIHVFSDGIQDSAAFKLRNLHSVGFNKGAIDQALTNLKSKGYLRSLAGVKVVFDRPGFQGQGHHSIVDGPSIQRFWTEWGSKTGAQVSF